MLMGWPPLKFSVPTLMTRAAPALVTGLVKLAVPPSTVIPPAMLRVPESLTVPEPNLAVPAPLIVEVADKTNGGVLV